MDGSTQAALLGVVGSFLLTGLIWGLGSRLDSIALLPDQGASWYYWKLPEPTFWSRATAWGFYLVHQLVSWGLIYYAQTRVKKYAKGLHPINYLALGLNGFFVLMHVLQTHLWYDGLAQDVSIWSSQGSVVVLLVLVLIMENRRRGMFFGKQAPLSRQVVEFVRKYHGYFFSWAIVYTFWYHPAVSTPGHLVGFFYMFLLMLQGSLFLTRIHVNKWWTFFQEGAVLIHGTIVAVYQGAGLWPMFFFGFGGIFIITQMHGLGLKRWAKYVLLFGYVGLAVVVYSQRGWAALNEIIRIPVIDYLLVFILAGVIGLGLRIARFIRERNAGVVNEQALA
ncbi:hypothetical protein KQH54_01180 [bacterium]|nr:hypothetical protein [bacterium]